jgi:hypothetical protein
LLIRDSSKIQLQYPDTQYSRIEQNQLKTKENKQAQIPDLDVKGTKPSSLLPHPCVDTIDSYLLSHNQLISHLHAAWMGLFSQVQKEFLV